MLEAIAALIAALFAGRASLMCGARSRRMDARLRSSVRHRRFSMDRSHAKPNGNHEETTHTQTIAYTSDREIANARCETSFLKIAPREARTPDLEVNSLTL